MYPLNSETEVTNLSNVLNRVRQIIARLQEATHLQEVTIVILRLEVVHQATLHLHALAEVLEATPLLQALADPIALHPDLLAVAQEVVQDDKTET